MSADAPGIHVFSGKNYVWNNHTIVWYMRTV